MEEKEWRKAKGQGRHDGGKRMEEGKQLGKRTMTEWEEYNNKTIIKAWQWGEKTGMDQTYCTPENNKFS